MLERNDLGEDWQARARHVAAADAWTARTDARLGISPSAVLEAIKRGWVSTEIDALRDGAELLGQPLA